MKRLEWMRIADNEKVIMLKNILMKVSHNSIPPDVLNFILDSININIQYRINIISSVEKAGISLTPITHTYNFGDKIKTRNENIEIIYQEDPITLGARHTKKSEAGEFKTTMSLAIFNKNSIFAAIKYKCSIEKDNSTNQISRELLIPVLSIYLPHIEDRISA